MARELGLHEPELIVVRGAALWRAGEVALRVERPATDAHQLLRLVKLAVAAGVPAVAPVRTEPIDHPDGQVTVWQWVEPVTDREPDTACLGRALRKLHDNVRLEDWQHVGAPSLLAQFERRMARNLDELAGTDFGSGLTELLKKHVSIWVARANDTLPTPLGSVALHGDAHPGNLITTAAGCRLAAGGLGTRLRWTWRVGPRAPTHARSSRTRPSRQLQCLRSRVRG